MFTSNEDYRDDGPAPADERAELSRIHREGHEKKLSVGTVQAFFIAPDGHLMDTMHVATVNPKSLAETLEKHARALGTPAGAPVVTPCPPQPPSGAPGDLRLHLTARYLERRGDELVLVENAGGNWSALPGEDWITLSRAEQAALLSTSKPKVGQTWDINRDVATRILNYFYPPTENNDIAKNKIAEQTLRATVVSVQRGVTTARLEGALRMKHPFYHKDDDKFVAANLVGYLEFDPARRIVRSLKMVTEGAQYGDNTGRQPFGVAVRSVPPGR